MTAWTLGIDFGTSNTAAAIGDEAGVRLVRLDNSDRMASAVLLADTGEIVVGQAALDRARAAPDRLELAPKTYLGSPYPMRLGGEALRAERAVAAILAAAAQEAVRQQGGRPPSVVRLTHPASWRSNKLGALDAAAREASLPGQVVMFPEPVAAASHYATVDIPLGSVVAVYDLGGGTFDTAVVRRTESSFVLAGQEGGRDQIAGDAFDYRLLNRVGESIASRDAELWRRLQQPSTTADQRDSRELLLEVRAAKEALSRHTTHDVFVRPLDSTIRVTREEFEELIRNDLEESVDLLEQTIRRAGLEPSGVAAIYRVGGSSRIPLVGTLLDERFGTISTTLDDPKAVVALGAAASPAGRGEATGQRRSTSKSLPPAEESQQEGRPAGRTKKTRNPASPRVRKPRPADDSWRSLVPDIEERRARGQAIYEFDAEASGYDVWGRLALAARVKSDAYGKTYTIHMRVRCFATHIEFQERFLGFFKDPTKGPVVVPATAIAGVGANGTDIMILLDESDGPWKRWQVAYGNRLITLRTHLSPIDRAKQVVSLMKVLYVPKEPRA
jgi:actin-like ATPase involved in cell morphogenesis